MDFKYGFWILCRDNAVDKIRNWKKKAGEKAITSHSVEVMS